MVYFQVYRLMTFPKMTYLTYHRIFLRARGKIIKARNVSHATIEHHQPSESHKRDFDARNNVKKLFPFPRMNMQISTIESPFFVHMHTNSGKIMYVKMVIM